MSKRNIALQELEVLTGKYLSGDITPIVYDLLKDTRYKSELISYLSEGKIVNVDNNKSNTTACEEDNLRPDFEKWFSGCEQL